MATVVHVSRYENWRSGNLAASIEARERDLARRRGALLVHDHVDDWVAHPDRSVRKYLYQQPVRAVYDLAWEWAGRVRRELPRDPAWVRSGVADGVLAVLLYVSANDALVVSGLETERGPLRAAFPPISSRVLARLPLTELAFSARDAIRSARASWTPPRLDRPTRGPVTWLLFVAHASSLALENLLDLVDRERTVCLVVPGHIPPSVIHRLQHDGFRCVDLRWPTTPPPGPALRWMAVFRDAVRRAGLDGPWGISPLSQAQAGRQWMLNATAPERLGVPFEAGDLLITANDRTPRWACFVDHARSRGVRTVTLQDGMFGQDRHIASFPSHRIGVMGDRYRRGYLESGVSPQRVITIGQRNWDRLRPLPVDQALRRQLFATDRRVAMVTTQYFPVSDLEMFDVIRMLHDALVLRRGWRLVVKPHPLFPIDHVLRHLPSDLGAPVRGTIDELLPAVDAVFAVSSTTLIEAALAGRLSGAVNLPAKPGWCPLADGHAVREIRSVDDVLRLVDEGGPFDLEAYRADVAARFDRDAAGRLLHDDWG